MKWGIGRMTNTLWTGDNLYVLTGMNSESVDLIYLDPPFNSKRTYSAPVGSKSAGASFKDMWTWNDVDEAHLENLFDNYPALVRYIESIGALHGKPMMAYITYMAQRIMEMHRILKPTGSLYLHCDPTASHYLKLILDRVFGKNNFQNEIAWCYKNGGTSKKWFSRKHDIIFFYSKSNKYNYNHIPIKNYVDSIRSTNEGLGIQKDIEGRFWRLSAPRDWWEISALGNREKERTGYPTQKPVRLMTRIIEASSNEGDVVMDPFCGCATTCVAAQKLNRQWIGIDIEKKAASVLVDRLSDDAGLFQDFIHRTDVPQRTDIKSEPPSPDIKSRLYKEQSGACNGCGESFDSRHFEIDHIIPKSRGGGDYYENYQLLCGNCNRVKGNRPMEYLTTKMNRIRDKMEGITFGN